MSDKKSMSVFETATHIKDGNFKIKDMDDLSFFEQARIRSDLKAMDLEETEMHVSLSTLSKLTKVDGVPLKLYTIMSLTPKQLEPLADAFEKKFDEENPPKKQVEKS